MIKTQQPEAVRKRAKNYYYDEIELIDILRVIWKWKYLILAGTLVCGVVVGIINYKMPKVFRVRMILQPGVVGIRDDGTKQYINKAETIKSKIETGSFKNGKNLFWQAGGSQTIDLSQLKVTVQADLNTVEVTYDTSKVDHGIAVLEKLGQFLSHEYKELPRHVEQRYEETLKKNRMSISLLKSKKKATSIHIKHINNRIFQLGSEIKLIDDNTKSLIEQRNKIVSNSNEKATLNIFLYSNAIQQNLSLKNTYQNQIYIRRTEMEELNGKLSELQLGIEQLTNECVLLEDVRNNIETIQILQTPTSSSYPIKPKKSVNVILGTVIGLFAMLFVAFFLEYIQKHKRELRP
jgi:capsular polysaccharide biosynthesis protein